MTLEEAKIECERWLAYLNAQKEKSHALQRLASDRRAGRCSDHEMRGRKSQIDGSGVTVYDGGNLEKAVRILLKQ